MQTKVSTARYGEPHSDARLRAIGQSVGFRDEHPGIFGGSFLTDVWGGMNMDFTCAGEGGFGGDFTHSTEYNKTRSGRSDCIIFRARRYARLDFP